jgi:hypothetical protein
MECCVFGINSHVFRCEPSWETHSLKGEWYRTTQSEAVQVMETVCMCYCYWLLCPSILFCGKDYGFAGVTLGSPPAPRLHRRTIASDWSLLMSKRQSARQHLTVKRSDPCGPNDAPPLGSFIATLRSWLSPDPIHDSILYLCRLVQDQVLRHLKANAQW